MNFFATTPKNMEGLLLEELRALGADDVKETRAGVSFRGELETAYRVCLWSRLASRVLLPLTQVPADTAEALYAGVRAIAWEEHLSADGSLAVDLSAVGARIQHSHYGALKVKDAIVDRFRDETGRRPSVDVQEPDVRVNVYVRGDQATVAIDLSGASLHRRAYRETGVPAPMKENLAAAVLMRAGWPEVARAGGAFVDPMCGSGTLPIEAALMAADIAPGLLRAHYGFLRWRGHDAGAWERLLDAARARREAGLPRLPPIVGYDRSAEAVRTAVTNVERAGLRGHVHVERRELARCERPGGRAGEAGLLAVNPPYGERLGKVEELVGLYAELGAALRERFAGWKAAVLTSNPELGKRMGLRARRKYTLFNGALECRLLCFDVTPEWYAGARLAPAQAQPPSAPEPGSEAEMFANRLRKNHRHLRKWAQREGVSCYRVYDADLPQFAVAVDLYEQWVHVQEYEAPPDVDERKAKQRLRAVMQVVPQVLEVPPANVFLKVRRQQKGSAQYQKQDRQGVFREVQEGPYRFLVNLTDYLDTGLFLDHRPTRALVGKLASRRRFLNLFAYTGTATVCAAVGGATATTTVDLSATYLDWAQRNLALNGVRDGKHAFIQADCREWLAADRGSYDLIFLDPPTFSNSKRMDGTFDVQRDHVELIRLAAARLAPGGILLFSNNRRNFKMDLEALAGLHVENISRSTLPPDFAGNARIHNCWKIIRAEARAKD